MNVSLVSLLSTIKIVLPILIVLTILEIIFGFMGLTGFVNVLAGSIMVVLGLFLFLNGVNVAVIPLARSIGSTLPQQTSQGIVVMLAFFMGLVINAADPAVHILVGHVDEVSNDGPGPFVLVMIIASSIGAFICISLVRIILKTPLAFIYGVGYGLILVLSFFVPQELVPLAFDAGGIATGPLTVPFILAFGLGFISVLGRTSDEGFGMLGLAAMGPILGVMITGIIFL